MNQSLSHLASVAAIELDFKTLGRQDPLDHVTKLRSAIQELLDDEYAHVRLMDGAASEEFERFGLMVDMKAIEDAIAMARRLVAALTEIIGHPDASDGVAEARDACVAFSRTMSVFDSGSARKRLAAA